MSIPVNVEQDYVDMYPTGDAALFVCSKDPRDDSVVVSQNNHNARMCSIVSCDGDGRGLQVVSSVHVGLNVCDYSCSPQSFLSSPIPFVVVQHACAGYERVHVRCSACRCVTSTNK